MAVQLEPFAKYLIASQIGIPIPGWPYNRVLMGLRRSFGRPMGPAEFCSWAVRRFCEAYPSTSPVSLSALDLQHAPALGAQAAVLAATLARAAGTADERARLADLFYRSQTDDDRPYVDVADLCLTLVRQSNDPLIREAARSLGDFLLSPTPPLGGLSETGAHKPFIIEQGRNAGSTARLNGVSLYAPHLVPGRDFGAPVRFTRTSSLCRGPAGATSYTRWHDRPSRRTQEELMANDISRRIPNAGELEKRRLAEREVLESRFRKFGRGGKDRSWREDRPW